MLKIGDMVKILNSNNIRGASIYFKDGDITEITVYKGYLALKHDAEELEGGLVVLEEEYGFLEIV